MEENRAKMNGSLFVTELVLEMKTRIAKSTYVIAYRL